MPIDVLDVGDGACSVVRCHYPDCEALTIVDCGEWRTNGRAAAEKLFHHVTYERIERLVVTHFDADHWWGLDEFARRPGVHFSNLELIYPAVPVEPRALSLIHISEPTRPY